MNTSLLMQGSSASRYLRLFLALLMIMLVSVSLPPLAAQALTASSVQIRMMTDPLLVSDSNGCSKGDGPQAAYVGFKITNTSGGTLSNLSVNLSDFDTGFGLAGGQAATQYIGTLVKGESDIVYWYVTYPCHTAADTSDTLTVTVSDGGATAPYAYSNSSPHDPRTTENVTTTIQSVDTISANAGGLYTSSSLGPGAVIGQIIPYDVTYSFGGATVDKDGIGDRYNLQPSGEPTFNAACFQLINTEILSSQAAAIPVGTRDDLFYYATQKETGSSFFVKVRYYFLYLCNGISTAALPYASQTSGSTNVKYAESGYTIDNQIVFPAATNAFQMSKSASPATLPAGGVVTYTVLITNTSAFTSSLSRIVDVLPAGVTYAALQTSRTSPEIVNRSSVQPANGASGTIQWQGGIPSTFPYDSYMIPPKSRLTLVYTANVPPTTGNYTNNVTAYVGPTAVGTGTSTVGVGQADLIVSKQAPLTVNAGDLLSYTITLTNTGPGTAGATLNDLLPASTTFVALTSPAGWTCTTPAVGSTGALACANPAFAPSTVSFTVQVRVGSGIASGTRLANTASSTSTLYDPTPTNNSSTITTTVVAPNLLATKRDSLVTDVEPTGFSAGDTVAYTIVVSNTGNGPANNVTFTDTPDANTILVPGSVTTTQGTVISSTGSVAVNIGTIAASSAVTVVFDITINNPLPDGVLQVANQGRVEATGLPPVLTDDPDTPTRGDPTFTPVTDKPILGATKSVLLLNDADNNGVANPGDTLGYTVVIINSGNSAATGVTFSDTPDPNTTLLPSTANTTTTQGTVTSGAANGDTRVAVAVGTLNGGGGSVTINFQVRINTPLPANVTQIDNQGIVEGSGLTSIRTDDPNTLDPNDRTIMPVTAEPSIAAHKTATLYTDADGNGSASPGDTLLYNIEVINSGNGAGLASFANDVLDPNLKLVVGSVTTTLGSVTKGNTPGDTSIGVNLGTIEGGGGRATITFRVTINNPLPAAISTVANQALISGSNFADVPTDDPNITGLDDPTDTAVTTSPLISASKSDVLVTDVNGNGIAEPGDTLLYQLTIINSGNSAATNVIFSDTPGANTTLVVGSVMTNRGGILLGNTSGDTSVSVNLGTLPGGGASALVSFKVLIGNIPAGVTQVVNQGTVTTNETGTTPTNDPQTLAGGDPTVTPVTSAPLLELSKQVYLLEDPDGNGVVSPGDTLLYRIVLTNNGNGEATGVALTDTPGANTTLVDDSVSTSQGTITSSTTNVAVTLGTLPANGASASVSFRATVNKPLPAGVTTVANQGLITATNIPNLPNGGSTDDPSTTPIGDPTSVQVLAAPDLVLTKNDSGIEIAASVPNQIIRYTLTYTNVGNQDATGVVITETVPANTTFSSAGSSSGWSCADGSVAGTTCTFNLGNVGVGSSGNVAFAVTVVAPLPADMTQISNTATIGDDGTNGPDPTPANNTGSKSSRIVPTAITLSYFSATREGDGVTVRWATGLELDTWGFHLYRSADGQRTNAVRVTPSLVPAQGNNYGANYVWVDLTVEADGHYSYWLEERGLDGSTHEYGPTRVSSSLAEGQYRVLLPLLVR